MVSYAQWTRASPNKHTLLQAFHLWLECDVDAVRCMLVFMYTARRNAGVCLTYTYATLHRVLPLYREEDKPEERITGKGERGNDGASVERVNYYLRESDSIPKELLHVL